MALSYSDLTAVQVAVVQAVRHLGAVTARRLERDHALKAAWEVLIRERWLESHDSVHGELIALGGHARTHCTAQNMYAPYLTSPSAVLDRAFQNDALELLVSEGYVVVDAVYKKATGISRARSGRLVTAQVLHHILRVPNCEPPDGYARAPRDMKERVRGHPILYATVSGGGMSEQRLLRLLKTHDTAIQAYWRSPLLIALPDPAAVRRVVREANTRQQRAVDDIERQFPHHAGNGVKTLVRLVHVPHPEALMGRYGE